MDQLEEVTAGDQIEEDAEGAALYHAAPEEGEEGSSSSLRMLSMEKEKETDRLLGSTNASSFSLETKERMTDTPSENPFGKLFDAKSKHNDSLVAEAALMAKEVAAAPLHKHVIRQHTSRREYFTWIPSLVYRQPAAPRRPSIQTSCHSLVLRGGTRRGLARTRSS